GVSSRSRTACWLSVRSGPRGLVPRGVDYAAVRWSGSRPAPQGAAEGVLRGLLPLLLPRLGGAVRVHRYRLAGQGALPGTAAGGEAAARPGGSAAAAAWRATAPRGRDRPGGFGPCRAGVASQHPGLPAADVRVLHPTAARHRAAGAAHRPVPARRAGRHRLGRLRRTLLGTADRPLRVRLCGTAGPGRGAVRDGREPAGGGAERLDAATGGQAGRVVRRGVETDRWFGRK